MELTTDSLHRTTLKQVVKLKTQTELLKEFLKKTVKDNPAIWLRKLDDALWAFCTTYKTPTGTTPYKLVYGKNYHLPFEIKHRAYWALKNCNLDLIAAGEKRMFQLHELDEIRHQAFENSHLYKERTKVWHDRKLKMRKEFKHGNKVLLFHSKYKFKQSKLRSRWLGPYVVKHQYPSEYVKLFGKDGKMFIVNDHRLKLYHEEEDYRSQFGLGRSSLVLDRCSPLRLYKARTKVWHDRKLKMRKEFKHGNKVLLFHSKYKFKQSKLRSRWLGPYVVKHQYPSEYVKLFGKDGKMFIVNDHRLKLYHEEEDYNDQREAVTPFFPKE
ncbi:reverse transcriptase domain-containing protein [Tanacetum coccineum]